MSIYLDYNATAPMRAEVADAVHEASLRYGGNPGSSHEAGRLARRALEEARERIGELLGARMSGMAADRIVFTSGGTEANHLALFGLLGEAQPAPAQPHLLISSIEHPCIAEPAGIVNRRGWAVDLVSVDSHGVVRLDELEGALKPETRLVCLMLANNETGVLQPVAEVVRLCAERRVLVHTDAAQIVGKLPVDFAQLGVDSLACAAHKFGGPLGIGALVLRHGLAPQPMMFGGHQQGGLRPGTEMVALAVGMQVALESRHRDAEATVARVGRLRDRLEAHLLAGFPSAVVVGKAASRLPNTSNIAMVGLDRQVLVMALDQAGIACSSGSACASGASEPSPVLSAMGLPEEVCQGAIRLSLGPTTTENEVDEAERRILLVVSRLQQAPNR